MLAGGFVDGILGCFWREDIIEGENFAIFSLGVDVSYCQLFLGLVRRQKLGGACVVLGVPLAVYFSVKGRTRTNTLIHSSGIWKLMILNEYFKGLSLDFHI